MAVRRSRVVLAAIVGAVAVGAAAAALGGLQSQSLGGTQEVALSCDTDGVTAELATSYSDSLGYYQVDSVVISSINATGCSGQRVSVAVSNGTTAATGLSAALASQTTVTVALSAGIPYSGELVTQAAVVIAGQ